MSEPTELSFTSILDWVEGRLDTAAASEVEQQVATSADAAATERWIRDYLRASRLMPLSDPPQDLRDRLRNTFRERVAPWDPTSFVNGHLVFDSRHEAVVGLRGTDEENIFHLRFEAENLGMLLTVTMTSVGEIDVAGSVEPHQGHEQFEGKDTRSGRDVVFTSARRVRRHVVCDLNGDFRVSDLEADVNEIWVGEVDSEGQARFEVNLHPQTT